MKEDVLHGYLLTGIGIVLVVQALTQESLNTQMILSVTGFLAVFIGLLKLRIEEKYIMEYYGKEDGGMQYLRPVGALMVFFSTVLPYLPMPLERGATRDAYSFIDLLHAMWLGIEIEGGITLLIFVSVVFAGAAASLLHYSGGYVVLFGVAGYGYVVSLLMEMSIAYVFMSEFRSGMYVAMVGAALIILSSLFRYRPEGGCEKQRNPEFIHEKRSQKRTDEDGGSRDTGGPVTSFET